jgi:hypothetical protein
MAETTQIIAAVAAQWNASSTLSPYILRSTRIPSEEVQGKFPYGLIRVKVLDHLFWSGDSQITDYLVTLTVYCGNSKAVVDIISAALTALFSRNIGLPVTDNCYVMSVLPVVEDSELEIEDFYGEDSNTLTQQFKIKLNEMAPAINKTLAT